MQKQLIKIAIAQINPIIGDIKHNLNLIIDKHNEAIKKKVDLLIFPEMVISGYPPYDLLYDYSLILSIKKSLKILKEKTKNAPAILLGYPRPIKKKLFKKKRNLQKFFNSYILFDNGKILSQGSKVCIPNYSIFNESRYFISGKNGSVFLFSQTIRIAILICEDLWYHKGFFYPYSPIQEIMKEKPDLIISINASPFDVKKKTKREKLIQKISKTYQIPIIYSNLWGNADGILFDGNSFFTNKLGEVMNIPLDFKDDFIELNYLVKNKKVESINHKRFIVKKIHPYLNQSHQIYNALVAAKRDYHEKTKINYSVIGISGGIDSAVALSIDVKALGSENVFAVLSPSRYSSRENFDLAKQLCKNFNVDFKVIPLEEKIEKNQWKGIYPEKISLYLKHFKEFKVNKSLENQQAIDRMAILRFYASEFSGLITGTSNKSELAMGYATLCGDLQADLLILGDLYKKDIYSLARFINYTYDSEKIPSSIFSIKPSAELAYNQYDPFDYKLLDYFLYLRLEKLLTLDEILCLKKNDKLIFTKELIFDYEKQLLISEYKRKNSSLIFKVRNLSFSIDRKIPILKKISYL